MSVLDLREPYHIVPSQVADGWYYHYHLNTIRVLLKHIVGELYKKEEQLNEMTGDQKPAEIHFELDSVTRASLEGQLLKSITAMCKQENADPNVIEARLDQLMGSITAKTSNASDNVTPMLTTMAAEMAAAAEDEDKENAAAEDSEDLEYDLFGDD